MTEQDEFEPIEPAAARRAIEEAMAAHLGENWRSDERWMVIHDTDYLVRVTRYNTNIDFYCDLLGEVSQTEQEIDPVQSSGRLIALMVLGASLALAFVIARVAGVIG